MQNACDPGTTRTTACTRDVCADASGACETYKASNADWASVAATIAHLGLGAVAVHLQGPSAHACEDTVAAEPLDLDSAMCLVSRGRDPETLHILERFGAFGAEAWERKRSAHHEYERKTNGRRRAHDMRTTHDQANQYM